jgi:AcrR family transcriptional regulator
VADAARRLFAEQGYEQTTVDQIADLAGVSRRTFFRYFRSKDEAILPDHTALLERIARQLDGSVGGGLAAICAGARVVFQSYVDEPEVSVERYRLTRSVPALQARETAAVQEYFRIFRRHLVGAAEATGPVGGVSLALRADVLAGAVVAAHNQVLRGWLRGGGAGDPMPELDQAFGWLRELFEPTGLPVGARTGPPDGAGPVVVAVFHRDAPLAEVVRRIGEQI